ncbi:DnaB-like helicase C-terminal domain-containing protein [Candidatus Ruminimicrobium bovinum]|uniref:DnaB-like helicase C-terminal domain-containing protein n=1 Tax=Candidatus Ruminimicrobium bovinum TaxID=3242779 RepID=UPI0039B9AEA0
MNKIKNLINGFLEKDKKEIITIIGKYSFDKTSFVANIVKNLAIDNNKSVAIVCTKEKKENFRYHLISLITNIDLADFNMKIFVDFNNKKIKNASDMIEKSKIYISNGQNFLDDLSKIADKKIDLLIIDSLTYLFLEMNTDKIMEKLKEISTNLNCSILTTYEQLYYPPTYKETAKKEEEFVKKASDTVIIMERDIVKLTIDSHTNQTQTIECKFNNSTGEFTEDIYEFDII